jgi:DNA-binding NtrC family response regulator
MSAGGAEPAPSSAATALETWLAGSPSLRPIFRGIERAAATDASVLILGEPGTGRSSLARALHFASPRRAKNLVEVDPAVVPATLFDADLFGFKKGAFTGAAEDTPGRVARSEGGTLVLDHLEDLPQPAQPKLLRLLSERRYTPLGGRERSADVRFVGLAPADLAERVRSGLFRPDLFFRLEVLAFRLPPLRERRADLPQLIAALLADLAERHGRPLPELSPRSLAWMKTHSWPGNLRELRNCLERALVMSEGGPLEPERPGKAGEVRPRTLLETEQEEIRKALAFCRGHQGQAAELLGISRKALWEKRKRFGIP